MNLTPYAFARHPDPSPRCRSGSISDDGSIHVAVVARRKTPQRIDCAKRDRQSTRCRCAELNCQHAKEFAAADCGIDAIVHRGLCPPTRDPRVLDIHSGRRSPKVFASLWWRAPRGRALLVLSATSSVATTTGWIRTVVGRLACTGLTGHPWCARGSCFSPTSTRFH